MSYVERPFYAILGVSSTASQTAIKRAYRELAKTMHPDAGGDPDSFIELTKAYNTLSDPEARAEYDLMGETIDINPIAFQDAVIEALADAFQQTVGIVVDNGVPLEAIRFIESMRNVIRDRQEEIRGEQNREASILRSMHELRSKIRRRGEEKNVFVEIIDKQIVEREADMRTRERRLRVIDRVAEEAANYEDVEQVIRTVQAGRFRSFWEKVETGGLGSVFTV